MNFKNDVSIVGDVCIQRSPLCYLITLSGYPLMTAGGIRYIYQILILFYLLLFPSLSFAFDIKIVPVSQICMVMNKVIDTKSISVVIDEDYRKMIYYVLSEECKRMIQSDSSIRIAPDPVTKISVYKADAVVGIDKEGNLNYFSSWDTLNLHLNKQH